MAAITKDFKSGMSIFATAPDDDEGVKIAIAWVRKKGYTPKDVTIRKFKGAVSVEVK